MATSNMADFGKVTADLMVALFSEEEMVACSITGTGKDKKQLDPDRTEALISRFFGSDNFNVVIDPYSSSILKF